MTVPIEVELSRNSEKLFLHSYQGKKILLVHPFLQSYGGAEYMLSVLATDAFPNADIFTLAWNNETLKQVGISKERVRSPFGVGTSKVITKSAIPFYPALIDSYIFREYDVILSLSYGYVHGLITSPDQLHLSFILTPMRKLWVERETNGLFGLPVVRNMYDNLIERQQEWDFVASARPDYLVAISQTISDRIKHYWRRDAHTIIYPPVDNEYFRPRKKVAKENYLVTHSRLVRHKRVDVLIKGCLELNQELIIIGDGPELERLKRISGNSSLVTFTGFISNQEKKLLLQKAKGYVFAGDEDFGISTVEAIASGTPALVYKAGGSTEIVAEGVNGMFFSEQSVQSFMQLLPRFVAAIENGSFSQEALIDSVAKFDKRVFLAQLFDLLVSL